MATSLQNARTGRDSSPSSLLIRYNTHTLWRTTSVIQTNGAHHHFFIWIPILHLATFSLFYWQHPRSGCDSRIDLVVALEYTLFPTPNKSLRFTRFRRHYVNRPSVVLIKVTLLFCLMCSVQSGHVLFFCSYLSPMMGICMMMCIYLTYFCWEHFLFKCC